MMVKEDVMGVDFTAILAHELSPVAVATLPHTLHPDVALELATAVRAVTELLKPAYPLVEETRPWKIRYAEHETAQAVAAAWAAGTSVAFEGPAGLLVWIGAHALTVWNV